MDLRLFHPSDDPSRNYKAMDRMNSRSGPLACHLYEWIGWYNSSVPQRLLGHYRLFQLYKARSPRLDAGMIAPRAYILQCQGTHRLKYFLNRCFTIVNFIITRGQYDRNIEVHGINRVLLYQRTDVLQEFLLAADNDFDQAFRHARHQIDDLTFLNPTFPISNTTLVQINNDHRHQTHIENEYRVHPIVTEQVLIKEGARGKEKGVFSKKQILILFDLVAESAKIERIDLKKPIKFEGVAALLQALTGHVKESWIAELKDYHNKGLYDYHSRGELDELLRILTNLSDNFGRAGFRSVANLADKKILELTVKGRSL